MPQIGERFKIVQPPYSFLKKGMILDIIRQVDTLGFLVVHIHGYEHNLRFHYLVLSYSCEKVIG